MAFRTRHDGKSQQPGRHDPEGDGRYGGPQFRSEQQAGRYVDPSSASNARAIRQASSGVAPRAAQVTCSRLARAAEVQEDPAAHHTRGQRDRKPRLRAHHHQDARTEHVDAFTRAEEEHQRVTDCRMSQAATMARATSTDPAPSPARNTRRTWPSSAVPARRRYPMQASPWLSAPRDEQRRHQRGQHARAAQQAGGRGKAHSRQRVEQTMQQRPEPVHLPRVRGRRRTAGRRGTRRYITRARAKTSLTPYSSWTSPVAEAVELQRAGDLQRIYGRLAHGAELLA